MVMKALDPLTGLLTVSAALYIIMGYIMGEKGGWWCAESGYAYV